MRPKPKILNLPFHFAKRYLFARKSANAINIITGISVFGITVGTAALLLVLSVFNGFEDLLGGLFGYFNPEIKITAIKGKTFETDSSTLASLRAIPEVAFVSECVEEIAFFEYEGSQDFGTLKGVDAHFARVNNIDSTIREGGYFFARGERHFAVLGAGLRNKLSVNVNNPIHTLRIYMPQEKSGALDEPFKTRFAYPAGTFAIQQEFDNQYVIADINFVRELLNASERTVSSLEIRCKKDVNLTAAKNAIRQIIGENFQIRDRYEQNEAFFKVMQLEKWMGFAITGLMLILMSFNMIGALWMIVLEKQKDISILKSMGASDGLVRKIFLSEGLLLTGIGLLLGILVAVMVYFGQKTFGWVSIPQGFLVESYPIAMRWTDFPPVVVTVLGIGWIASLIPAIRAMRVPAFLREE